ncbi:hypothetical protein [Streptomyces sp. CB03911]|uniref:hypothetical protein n=1 Tax=Streptomyces sp. CB03911 TaxID=1804758 RepID=UPI00093E6636|nr:hypothetical protein [Streptomyces sp. CB03911]OKI22194.1 hypothetical protein A6A07_34530 [Streptomyces sp. CB03911]
MTLSITRPSGLILVKGHPVQGSGNEIFGIWPSGLVRQVTAAEFIAWGSPVPDRELEQGPAGDAEFNQLRAYDNALRA